MLVAFIKRNSYFACLFFFVITFSLIFTIRLGDPVEYITVQIENGDSLWNLSEEYKSKHRMTNDGFIAWVVRENQLDNTELQPGEILILPIETIALSE